MHCFLASHQDLMLVPLEFREEDRGMVEVKVRLLARGYLAVSPPRSPLKPGQ